MKNQWLDENITTVSDDPRRIPRKPDPLGPNRILVLKNARIFDGTGKSAYNGSIVLHKNKVHSVVTGATHEFPKNAEIIDLEGKTIMPGLIDAHTHLDLTSSKLSLSLAIDVADCTLRALERMTYYIESGITSIRDCASAGTFAFRLKDWVAKNSIPGPRIFPAGQLITSTGGHGTSSVKLGNSLEIFTCEASGPHEWRDKVRYQFKKGADFIKTGSPFSQEEIEAAVDEAHSLGLKITTDAERDYIEKAVKAGVDVVEHSLPRTDQVIQLMAERKVYSVPTLIPYDIIIDSEGGYFGNSTRRFTLTKDTIRSTVRKMKDAGIEMGIGTDIFYEVFPAIADVYYMELHNLEELGFSASEVLCMATRVNSKILDMSDKLGTLEPGKLADLIVVNGQPDKDLASIKNIDLVIRDGYIVVKNKKINMESHHNPPLASLIEKMKSNGLDLDGC